MSQVDQATFEVLRLAAERVADGVALVELEARVPQGPWDDARLVAGAAEIAPVPGSLRHRDGRLRALFAVPQSATDLAVRCDGLLVRLPEPDGDRSDRLAVLAREANDLRHRMFEAEQARDDARDELERVVAERDRLKLRATDADDERKLLRTQLQRSRVDLERLTRELAQAQQEAAEPAPEPGPEPAPEPTPDAAGDPADETTTYPPVESDAVRAVAGRPSPRRHDGDPTHVPTQPAEPPPTPLYLALAAFGVLGLLLFLTILF